MKFILINLCLLFLCFNLFGQKTSNIKALKMDDKTSTQLKAVKTDVFQLSGNVLTPAKGYKTVYSKKLKAFIIIRSDMNLGGLPPATEDGTQDLGGGVTLRCDSSSCNGCDPTEIKGRKASNWVCSKCTSGDIKAQCSTTVNVPADKVMSYQSPNGEWNSNF